MAQDWPVRTSEASHLCPLLCNEQAGVSLSQSEASIRAVDQSEAAANCGVNTPYCVALLLCNSHGSLDKADTSFVRGKVGKSFNKVYFLSIDSFMRLSELEKTWCFHSPSNFDFGKFFFLSSAAPNNIQPGRELGQKYLNNTN